MPFFEAEDYAEYLRESGCRNVEIMGEDEGIPTTFAHERLI
jgi:hypothetical protein